MIEPQKSLISDPLLTLDQVAEIFHIKMDKQKQNMRKFLKKSGLPFVVRGREKLFCPSDIEKYIVNNRKRMPTGKIGENDDV